MKLLIFILLFLILGSSMINAVLVFPSELKFNNSVKVLYVKNNMEHDNRYCVKFKKNNDCFTLKSFETKAIKIEPVDGKVIVEENLGRILNIVEIPASSSAKSKPNFRPFIFGYGFLIMLFIAIMFKYKKNL